MAEKKKDTITVRVDEIDLTVDGDWRDDFDLVEAIGQMDLGNDLYVPAVLYKLAGDKANQVKESLRTDDGKLKVTEVRNWVLRFLNAANAKN